MPLLALGAWAGGLLAPLVPPAAATALGGALLEAGPWGLLGAGTVVLVVLARVGWPGRGSAPRPGSTATGVVVVLLAVLATGVVRADRLSRDPVAGLASDRATASAEVTVTGDPRLVAGRFGDRVLFRGVVERVTGRGAAYDVHVPVLVVADPGWPGLRLGARVRPGRTSLPVVGPEPGRGARGPR